MPFSFPSRRPGTVVARLTQAASARTSDLTQWEQKNCCHSLSHVQSNARDRWLQPQKAPTLRFLPLPGCGIRSYGRDAALQGQWKITKFNFKKFDRFHRRVPLAQLSNASAVFPVLEFLLNMGEIRSGFVNWFSMGSNKLSMFAVCAFPRRVPHVHFGRPRAPTR